MLECKGIYKLILVLSSADEWAGRHRRDLYPLLKSDKPAPHLFIRSAGFEWEAWQTKSHLSRQLKLSLCWQTDEREAKTQTDQIASATHENWWSRICEDQGAVMDGDWPVCRSVYLSICQDINEERKNEGKDDKAEKMKEIHSSASM